MRFANFLLQSKGKWCKITFARTACEQIPPPVAKLDIAVDSDSKGRGFESLRAGQKQKTDKPLKTLGLSVFSFFFFCLQILKNNKEKQQKSLSLGVR